METKYILLFVFVLLVISFVFLLPMYKKQNEEENKIKKRKKFVTDLFSIKTV